MMKLWLLKPIKDEHGGLPWEWHTTWDCTYGFVIRAESEDFARTMIASSGLFAEGAEAGDEGAEAWLDSNLTSCVELIAEGDPAIIIKDFLAG